MRRVKPEAAILLNYCSENNKAEYGQPPVRASLPEVRQVNGLLAVQNFNGKANNLSTKSASLKSSLKNAIPISRNSSNNSSNGANQSSNNQPNATSGNEHGHGHGNNGQNNANYQMDSGQPGNEPQMIRYLGSSMQVRSEQKATKVLGVVFFTFVICWSPFFFFNLLSATMDPDILAEYISAEMMDGFQWLGYISSTINPIIYTVFNRNFRLAFRQLLLCRQPQDVYMRSRNSERNKSFRFSQYNRQHPTALGLNSSMFSNHTSRSHSQSMKYQQQQQHQLHLQQQKRYQVANHCANEKPEDESGDANQMTRRLEDNAKQASTGRRKSGMLIMDDQHSPPESMHKASIRSKSAANLPEGQLLLMGETHKSSPPDGNLVVDSTKTPMGNNRGQQVASALRCAFRTTSSLFTSTPVQTSQHEQSARRSRRLSSLSRPTLSVYDQRKASDDNIDLSATLLQQQLPAVLTDTTSRTKSIMRRPTFFGANLINEHADDGPAATSIRPSAGKNHRLSFAN